VTAPVGAEVGLYVDLVDEVALGDVIETQTGRRYLVTARRLQERGQRVGRQHLRCVVLEANSRIDDGSHVHRIRWYSRRRRGDSRLRSGV